MLQEANIDEWAWGIRRLGLPEALFMCAFFHLILTQIRLTLRGRTGRQNGLCLKLGGWGKKSLGKIQ